MALVLITCLVGLHKGSSKQHAEVVLDSSVLVLTRFQQTVAEERVGSLFVFSYFFGAYPLLQLFI